MSHTIFEEEELKGSIISVYDRLMKDRIICVNTDVNTYMAENIKAKILYLSTQSEEPIHMIINTPGGSVVEGLSIYDGMELSPAPIYTTGHGMCASMGSVLIGAGQKGHRSITKYSRVMIHQISYGVQGNRQDINISHVESEYLNEILFNLLAEFTDQEYEKILKDGERDFWLNSVDALLYGIVDNILWDNNTTITLDNLNTIKNHILYKQSKFAKLS